MSYEVNENKYPSQPFPTFTPNETTPLMQPYHCFDYRLQNLTVTLLGMNKTAEDFIQAYEKLKEHKDKNGS